MFGLDSPGWPLVEFINVFIDFLYKEDYPLYLRWWNRFKTTGFVQRQTPEKQQEQNVVVYPIICTTGESTEVFLQQTGTRDYWLFYTFDSPTVFTVFFFSGAVECVMQRSHPSIRPFFCGTERVLAPWARPTHRQGKPGLLLFWVLLNARTRSIRDSGLLRL